MPKEPKQCKANRRRLSSWNRVKQGLKNKESRMNWAGNKTIKGELRRKRESDPTGRGGDATLRAGEGQKEEPVQPSWASVEALFGGWPPGRPKTCERGPCAAQGEKEQGPETPSDDGGHLWPCVPGLLVYSTGRAGRAVFTRPFYFLSLRRIFLLESVEKCHGKISWCWFIFWPPPACVSCSNRMDTL